MSKQYITIEKLEDGHYIAEDNIYKNMKRVCDDFFELVKMLEEHFGEERVDEYAKEETED